MARQQDELLKFWAVVVLVAVTAASLGVTTWGALQFNDTAAQPIRIELSSLPSKRADGAVDLTGAPGVSVAAEPYSIEADGELPLTVSLEPSGGLSGVWVGETGPGTSDEKLSSGLPVGPRTLEYEFAGRSGPGQGSPGASAIAIRKALRINGIDSGYAHIRVSARSLLSISIDELSRALTANGRRAAATQIAYGSSQDGFIGLEELRRQGFDIRFDARADRIVLDL